MFKKILIVTIVIFTLLSCSIDDDNSNFSIETLPIKEAIIPTEFIFGESYTLKVIYDLPSGCHSFYDLFYQYEGTARIVAINPIVDNASACTLATIEKEYTFVVNVRQQEDYTFKFWKGTDDNGDDIFEEVVVPVSL
jgi:ABC-type dipeptide/oligopeptide/nickel transport system permease subunit